MSGGWDMYCCNCGTKINGGAHFCHYCGSHVSSQETPAPPVARPPTPITEDEILTRDLLSIEGRSPDLAFRLGENSFAKTRMGKDGDVGGSVSPYPPRD